MKWELLIGVLIAYVIIIVASIYFFRAIERKMKEIKQTTEFVQSKMNILNEIEQQLSEAEQFKARYLLINDDTSLERIAIVKNRLQKSLILLRAELGNKSEFQSEINKLENSIETILNESKIEEQKKNSHDNDNKKRILSEQNLVNNHIFAVSNHLISHRDTQNDIVYTSVDDLKQLAYFIIGLPLIFVLYITNRVLKINKAMLRNKIKLEKFNQEYQEAQIEINNNNWILEESTKLYESISGIDDEDLIAEKAFKSISHSTSFFAGALYIRKANEYLLKQSTGFDATTSVPASFQEGEGLLGMAMQSKDIQVMDIPVDGELRSSSAIASNQIETLILTPLMFEQEALGILEIGGRFDKTQDLPRIIKYLRRVSRNLAMAIKVGHNHVLVEHLLAETQQQTEELEAQQEELRITNEELIYKTNLLESSEEELRVQQEELQQANTELEEKAHQLELRNEELNLAQKTVEEKIQEVELASKYKSEFMANMSHELRTPLNSILILAKLLKDNKGQNLNQDQVRYASVIHSAGNDLLQLINELLDLAKIESGKVELHFEEIDTHFFATSMENLFAATAAEKDIQFEVIIDKNTPPLFISDEYRVEQVVKNFLSNAFKFTEANGKVSFAIKSDRDNLKFIVTDTGKGIPEEKQGLIFEAFHQEDGSTSRKYGGTGLGLSISREIASLLGGRIALQSKVEEGSTFTLIIPYKAPEETHKNVTIHPQQKTEKKEPVKDKSIAPEESTDVIPGRHLLIIEDDVNFAYILKEFAETDGFHVMLAHDGAEGIQKAKQFRPHAIILDVMLPLFDGWEVLRTLKADATTKHIPIHTMSAATLPQKDFIEKGAIGFLSKPVTEESLKKAFETIDLHLKEGIKKVLLIEDQEFQSEIIKSTFAEQRINVIQAFTAHSALAKLNEEPNIDGIILDIKLPDANGLEVLKEIRSIPKYQDTPIIINTAYELSKEQIDQIHKHTKTMVLKSGKSNNRLIDEVTLFLNKISSEDYSPVKNMNKLKNIQTLQDNLQNKKVLIADDDMRNVFALTTTLQEYGMDIEIANNGLEALEIINKQPVDIVLMDIMMPEMDGFEAIEKIRSNKQHASLPIIAVTAKAMKGDREKSIQIGASDYISKPIDIDKLVSLMRVWLS